eukprot:3627624-Amphidinium_carterae.1
MSARNEEALRQRALVDCRRAAVRVATQPKPLSKREHIALIRAQAPALLLCVRIVERVVHMPASHAAEFFLFLLERSAPRETIDLKLKCKYVMVRFFFSRGCACSMGATKAASAKAHYTRCRAIQISGQDLDRLLAPRVGNSHSTPILWVMNRTHASKVSLTEQVSRCASGWATLLHTGVS